jgi:hypothetical protein
MTQDVKDLIVYSKFIPATYFGRPVTSKVQVALHAADRLANGLCGSLGTISCPASVCLAGGLFITCRA